MTIFRHVVPLPDESLAGLVARAAGANIYPHAHDILVLAGLGAIRPETIAGKSVDTADSLAEVLGTEPGLLRPLYHHAIDDRMINFFGTSLRAVHRETRLRRVSPRALADRAYIRAIWSIRPLTFDLGTRETLISNCPVCQKKLGFTQTWGVEFCEHCIETDQDGLPVPVVDLREFPQALIEVDDGEALDFVVGLIDPQCTDRRQPAIHDDLADMSRGDLFEMALALAGAILTEEQGLPVKPETSSRLAVEVTPTALADAGRIIMSWPAGFDGLCAKVAKRGNERLGQWGMFKEFGALAQLRNDDHLHVAAKRAISARLENAMADVRPNDTIQRKTTRNRQAGTYIGVRQLLREIPVSSRITSRLGAHPKMITYRQTEDPMAPVLFHSWQARTVLGHYQDLLSEVSLGVTLGLPPDALRDVARMGLVDGDTTNLRSTAVDVLGGGVHYSKTSADRFVDVVAHALPFKKRPKGFIPFSEAMLMFPAGRRPWLPVMLPILRGEVDAIFHHNVAAQPKIRNLFPSISVNAQQIEQQRACILEEHTRAKDHDIGRVSAVMTIMILGLYNHLVFMALDEAKLIDVNDHGADYRSLLDFAGEYIFLNEAAVRSRSSRQMVRPWLKARGVQPAYDFDCKGGTIYERAKVEPWLEMKAS